MLSNKNVHAAKRILVVFALLLTVVLSSAFTTMWLSARPSSAYGDIDMLERKVNDLEYEVSSLKNRLYNVEMGMVYGRCDCY